MRKTKIICTLGPSTDREDILRDMILSGMNVARFNFSHGDYAEHTRRLEMLKRLRTELNCPVAALLDTKGPDHPRSAGRQQYCAGDLQRTSR